MNYDPNVKPGPIADQQLKDVAGSWPKGDITVECNDYMFRPNQKWNITRAEGTGGYLGNPYYKIQIAGTDRTLTVGDDLGLKATESFSGSDYQLWRIEQLTDGTYRIMPKRLPGHKEANTSYVLFSIGDCTPVLARYDFSSDNSKWNLRQPLG